MKILHLDSSLQGAQSVSRLLSAEIVTAWRLAVPGLQVVRRDLALDCPPPLSTAVVAAQAGKTFQYTPNGPVGLAGDKRIVIASARGNVYSTPAMAGRDFQETYLQAALGFMGITRFDIVRAEGVNRGPDLREAALASARQRIAALFAPAGGQ
jgi:FMN-dependent NADH-azoreductase